MNSELNTDTPSISTAKVIYILYIVGTIVPITAIIGLVMAYVMQDDSADPLQTHYRFQIRTFWICVLYTVAGTITIHVMLGYFILVFTFIWLIVRCTKGLKQLEKNQPVKNLESWLFT